MYNRAFTYHPLGSSFVDANFLLRRFKRIDSMIFDDVYRFIGFFKNMKKKELVKRDDVSNEKETETLSQKCPQTPSKTSTEISEIKHDVKDDEIKSSISDVEPCNISVMKVEDNTTDTKHKTKSLVAKQNSSILKSPNSASGENAEEDEDDRKGLLLFASEIYYDIDSDVTLDKNQREEFKAWLGLFGGTITCYDCIISLVFIISISWCISVGIWLFFLDMTVLIILFIVVFCLCLTIYLTCSCFFCHCWYAAKLEWLTSRHRSS
jgi:hypothetical protein